MHGSTRDEAFLPCGRPEEPGDPCLPWRGTLRFRPQLQIRTSAPAATVEECRGGPRYSRGDWTSLRVLEWVPEVTIFTRDEPCCNLRKTRIIPSKQAETIYGCGISREILPPLLSPERFLDTLEATQEVPRHPSLPSRGTSKVPPQLKKSLGSPSSAQEESPFPCFGGEGIPAFP